jgi:dihydroxy-acid dehydratase
MAADLRHKSRTLLEGTDRAAARAMMKAWASPTRISRAPDRRGPFVDRHHACNWNHRKLAEKVMQGVRAAAAPPSR